MEEDVFARDLTLADARDVARTWAQVPRPVYAFASGRNPRSSLERRLAAGAVTDARLE